MWLCPLYVASHTYKEVHGVYMCSIVYPAYAHTTHTPHTTHTFHTPHTHHTYIHPSTTHYIYLIHLYGNLWHNCVNHRLPCDNIISHGRPAIYLDWTLPILLTPIQNSTVPKHLSVLCMNISTHNIICIQLKNITPSLLTLWGLLLQISDTRLPRLYLNWPVTLTSSSSKS